MAPMQAVQHARKRTVHSYTRARLASEESMKTKTKTEAEAPTETVQAAEPTATAEAQAAEAPMSLEDAMAKIADLEAKLAAMEAATEEMSAQLAAVPLEDEEMKAKEVREAACIATVDAAISEGRFARDSRDRWLAIARTNLDAAKSAIATMPARTQRVTSSVSRAANVNDGSAPKGESPEALIARHYGNNKATAASVSARLGKVG
jgi:chromosome segregation ATPase